MDSVSASTRRLSGRPGRRHSLLLTLLLAACVFLGTTFVGAGRSEAATSVSFLGALGTNPTKAASESNAGLKVAMMELSWRKYEPTQGVFDLAYEREMKGRLASLRAAGMRVTLGLGLHFTPTWVTKQPNSTFVNQNGSVSSTANLVFNAKLRTQAESYLARANSALGFSNVWSIRITSGGRGELIYPEGGTYWAFDANAQNGADLPTTMAPNPFPGWKPGTSGLTQAQVKLWGLWYVDGLVDVARWQINTVRQLGFTGYSEILTPGVGIYARKLDVLAASNLPNGFLGAGAYWSEVYKQLSVLPNVVANISSLADGSGSNKGCTTADRSVDLYSTDTVWWGSARWISRIADEYGLKKVGENPQYSSSNASFYTNTTSTGMMSVTMNQATSCNFFGVYWAHDDQFWNGATSLTRYAAYGSPGAVAPAAATTK